MGDLYDSYIRIKAQRSNCHYSDLKRLLLRCGFELKREEATHSVFKHPLLKQHVNIVRDGNRVKLPVYVDNAIKAIDEVNYILNLF